jgi:hypothetical protein
VFSVYLCTHDLEGAGVVLAELVRSLGGLRNLEGGGTFAGQGRPDVAHRAQVTGADGSIVAARGGQAERAVGSAEDGVGVVVVLSVVLPEANRADAVTASLRQRVVPAAGTRKLLILLLLLLFHLLTSKGGDSRIKIKTTLFSELTVSAMLLVSVVKFNLSVNSLNHCVRGPPMTAGHFLKMMGMWDFWVNKLIGKQKN